MAMSNMDGTRLFNWALSAAAAMAIDWGRGAGAGGIRSCCGCGGVVDEEWRRLGDGDPYMPGWMRLSARRRVAGSAPH